MIKYPYNLIINLYSECRLNLHLAINSLLLTFNFKKVMKLKTLLSSIVLIIISGIVSGQSVDPAKVLSYLKFDGNFNDASNKSVTYSLNSGNISYETGQFGQAAKFDAAALVSEGLGFNPINDFTIAAWINMDILASAMGGGHTWIHQLDGGGVPGRIHLEVLQDGDNISNFTSGIRLNATTPSPIVVNTWYHTAVVNNTVAGTCYLYIDGVKVGEVTNGTESTDTELVIGARKQLVAENRASGLIDELLITNEALDDAAINYIKNNGVAAAMIATNTLPKKSEFKLYYNNKRLNINRNSDAEAVLKVYSISGKLITSNFVNNKNLTLEMDLNKGVYLVTLLENNKLISAKISVN